MTREDALQEIRQAAKAKRGAALASADLSGTALRGAALKGANLEGANLYRADLREADLTGATLRQANLQEADLMSATMEQADLRQANLFEASLRGAKPRQADLRGAILIDAEMRNVDFSGADLRDVRLGTINPVVSGLTGAVLGGADLSGAKGIVRLPVGHPEGYGPVAVWHGREWWIGAGCWFLPAGRSPGALGRDIRGRTLAGRPVPESTGHPGSRSAILAGKMGSRRTGGNLNGSRRLRAPFAHFRPFTPLKNCPNPPHEHRPNPLHPVRPC